MFARLVYESFRRQKRRKLLAGAAIALGVTVATAMIAVATDIGDKINRELRTIGANLLVTPQDDTLDVEIGGVNLKPPSDGAFLNEADLPKIKGTFWHNNITGFAPMLPVNVAAAARRQDGRSHLLGTYFAKRISFSAKKSSLTGVRSTNPWWKVSGAWPDDGSRDVLLGERLAGRLAAKPGMRLTVSGRQVAGEWNSLDRRKRRRSDRGSHCAGAGNSGQTGRGSARLRQRADQAGRCLCAPRSPRACLERSMTVGIVRHIRSRLLFSCRRRFPIPTPSRFVRSRRTKGAVLTRIEGLIFLITLAALFASALAVSAAMATAIFERRAEVGLMKALGAGRFAVASVFFAEATLLALIGGCMGFAAGGVLAHEIGRAIFNSQITIAPVLLPVILVDRSDRYVCRKRRRDSQSGWA